MRFTHRVTCWIGGELPGVAVLGLSEKFGGLTLKATRGVWTDDGGYTHDEGGTEITVLVHDVRQANEVVHLVSTETRAAGEEAIAFTIDETSGGIR